MGHAISRGAETVKHDAKRDENELNIVRGLEAFGFSVQRLSGGGLPDLLVGRANRNWLLEVKIGAGRMNKLQKDWHARWRGHVAVVHTLEEALAAVGLR